MSLVVFGGSFDPPHRGHLSLLRAGLRAVKGSRALVVPAFRSPHKSGAKASARDRLALLRTALAGLPPRVRKRVSIDPFELDQKRPTYTYKTLRHLREKHPEEQLWLLLGSDAAAAVHSWKRPKDIAASCRLLIGRRPRAELAERFLDDGRSRVLPGVFPKISSSKIRLRLLLDKPVSGLLPGAVLTVLRRRGLYGSGIRARLAAELRPGRFAHTIAVARHAADLAKRHGLDAEQAALAGLLHDCGRAVPTERMAEYAGRHRLAVPSLRETAARQPILLHAHISEQRARSVYGISDSAVLSAIRKHTLGDRTMTPLDRLVYAADASSADRSYPGVGRIRAAARRDLDEGFAQAVRRKLAGIIERGGWLHPAMAAVWGSAIEHL